ncbi:MAG: DUF6268 family outer membrane beta-barrel protein [Prevotellaceae bacterium]|jgi:hypothetical protein|nr:DUF6268 family outer membrane beta-barrel protein [Prevotellaceae bacterium]
MISTRNKAAHHVEQMRGKRLFSCAKNSLILLLFFSLLINGKLYGQIQIESSCMTPSNYRDENNNKIGGSGDFKDVRLGLQIPVHVKMNELNQPTAWAVALKGTYASMNNTELATDFCISQLLNAELGVIHLRPLNEKWSLIASLGGGVYSDLSEFSANSMLAHAGVLFIRRMRPNLDLGFGVALNNAIGYPMIFPSFYFKWETGTRYEVKISLYDDFRLTAGMKINDVLALRLIAQARGMSAIVTRDNQSKIFTQQFSVIGLQPEIYVNKWLSIPVTAGVSVKRDAYFLDRKLISFYHTEENYPNFATSFYVSAGLKFFFDE